MDALPHLPVKLPPREPIPPLECGPGSIAVGFRRTTNSNGNRQPDDNPYNCRQRITDEHEGSDADENIDPEFHETVTWLFVQEANKLGLANLKGHKIIGGIRASIYNAMPESGVDALLSFMKDFEKRYG